MRAYLMSLILVGTLWGCGSKPPPPPAPPPPPPPAAPEPDPSDARVIDPTENPSKAAVPAAPTEPSETKPE